MFSYWNFENVCYHSMYILFYLIHVQKSCQQLADLPISKERFDLTFENLVDHFNTQYLYRVSASTLKSSYTKHLHFSKLLLSFVLYGWIVALFIMQLVVGMENFSSLCLRFIELSCSFIRQYIQFGILRCLENLV